MPSDLWLLFVIPVAFLSTLKYPSTAAKSSTVIQLDSLVPSSILFLSWKEPDTAKPNFPKFELWTKLNSGFVPSSLVESFNKSTEKEFKEPFIDKGLVVTILIVDPIPPDGSELLVDL